MNKFLIITIAFLFASFSNIEAFKLDKNEEKYIEDTVKKIELDFKNKTQLEKDDFIKKLSKKIDNKNLSFKNSYILYIIKSKLNLNQIEARKKILDSNNYIDMIIIEDYLLNLYNKVRTEKWLEKYSFDELLNKTATQWSEISQNRWEISHKRNSSDSYYNYNKINSWFKDRWIICKNINRSTHTENIWYWVYNCNDNNCNDELSKWIKWVFDSYLKEKDKQYKAHYNSIIEPNFRKIWLWIAINKTWNNTYKFYMTIHFCTEIIK